MRSDGTGVEVDYDEPGSPLDRYLASLDLEFHPAAGTDELNLAQQLHNSQAESNEQTKADIEEEKSQIEQDLNPVMFAKNLCSRMKRGAAEYLQGLKDNHLIKASKLEYDSRTFLQQQLADFQLDDALEVLNNELDRAHVLSTKEITRSPFPKYAGHIFAVYLALIIKNAHSFPIWINVIHFCLAAGGLWFLLSWLRYYLIYWSFHDNVKENLKQVEDMKETFDLMDRTLQRSLRFIRDMQVLNKGFTTIKSPTSNQGNAHRCPRDAHLMKSYVKTCLTFVCERLDPETPLNLTSIDSELEMLIIEYHERRSIFIRKSASQLLKDSLFFRSVSIQDEIRLLEQQIDRIRRLDLDPHPENEPTTNNQVSDEKRAVLRSLAIHAQLLAREAYQDRIQLLIFSHLLQFYRF